MTIKKLYILLPYLNLRLSRLSFFTLNKDIAFSAGPLFKGSGWKLDVKHVVNFGMCATFHLGDVEKGNGERDRAETAKKETDFSFPISLVGIVDIGQNKPKDGANSVGNKPS
jgi:hypothetical protein